jgi:hypothetical protein
MMLALTLLALIGSLRLRKRAEPSAAIQPDQKGQAT